MNKLILGAAPIIAAPVEAARYAIQLQAYASNQSRYVAAHDIWEASPKYPSCSHRQLSLFSRDRSVATLHQYGWPQHIGTEIVNVYQSPFEC